jgi:hypothetical protein
MEHLKLGPNGGLIYCMEYIEKNLDWLRKKLKPFEGLVLLLSLRTLSSPLFYALWCEVGRPVFGVRFARSSRALHAPPLHPKHIAAVSKGSLSGTFACHHQLLFVLSH